MHLQVRVVPSTSPYDLAKLLGVLARGGVNLVAAGGGDLELGGEFAFAPAHDHVTRALRVLEEAHYPRPRVLNAEAGDFRLCWVSDEPGALYRCMTEVAEANLDEGKVIRDILVGVEKDEQGRIPVQIYSVEVKTRASQGA